MATSEHPFQRWLKCVDTVEAKWVMNGSALVALHASHQSYFIDQNGFETECNQREDASALISTTLTQQVISSALSLVAPIVTESRQLIALEEDLRHGLDVLMEGVKVQMKLRERKEAILSLVLSWLLRIKITIVLCHVFAPHFVVASRRLDRMQALHNGFLEQAIQLLDSEWFLGGRTCGRSAALGNARALITQGKREDHSGVSKSYLHLYL